MGHRNYMGMGRTKEIDSRSNATEFDKRVNLEIKRL